MVQVAAARWPEIISSVIAAMRKQRFDLAIDLQGLARSGMFAWLANAKLTVGLDNIREGAREGARAVLRHHLLRARRGRIPTAVDRFTWRCCRC